MKKVKLTQNKYALVDDADFEWLNQWHWIYDGLYASRNQYLGKIKGKYKYKKIYMHRLVNDTTEGLLTDHINQDKLDNRKSNLRTGNKKLNSINRGLQSNNKSGYRGVAWDKINRNWQAKIKVNQRNINLGRFSSKDEAIEARKLAEAIYFTTCKI